MEKGNKANSTNKFYNWVFTLNNYTQEEEDNIKLTECIFMIYGHEHPDTTPHLQGYVQFKNQKRLNEVKKALGTNRLHLEVAQGTAEQNITYCSKEDTTPFTKGEPKTRTRPIKDIDTDLLEAIEQAQEGNIEEALEAVKQTAPRDYLLYKNVITTNLTSENKTRKKYDLPDLTAENNTLKPQQKKVWDLLQQTPKQRRIIWVTGKYGSGKSFLYNYIKENHNYGMYDAGQTASLDNLAYGYDEEGVIAWDLPRTFDYDNLGNAISNVIEKFSDFGQSITSKKYSGKTQKVRGHAIVFSNAPPLPQLLHRDVIHIDLTDEPENEVIADTHITGEIIQPSNGEERTQCIRSFTPFTHIKLDGNDLYDSDEEEDDGNDTLDTQDEQDIMDYFNNQPPKHLQDTIVRKKKHIKKRGNLL